MSNDDLDTLRPEVREAVDAFDIGARVGMTFGNKTWNTIRAELLRLAMIESDALIALDCEHDWQVEHERAEKAEAELAALKDKIADAPITQVTRMAASGGSGYEWAGCRVPDAWNGKRVRLLLVTATEDGPTGSQPASRTPDPAPQG